MTDHTDLIARLRCMPRYAHDDCRTIARYTGTPGRIRGWLLACAIGLGLALATVHWWSA